MLLLLVSVIVYQWMPITKKKDILVLGDELADGLNDTLITAEAKYFINITKFRKKICFSRHHSLVSSFLYANM